MHEAVFTLKQHTPMLHFLHDQPGATLRATELKPKLDKWIRRAFNNTLPEEWIAHTDSKGHVALDYKLTIRVSGSKRGNKLEEGQKEVMKELANGQKERKLQWVTKTAFPQVLANVGGKDYQNELKNFTCFDGIAITIKTWHEELLAEIKQYLPKLVASENFGNRPSKGFGSFSCVAIDDATIRSIPNLQYYFDIDVDGQYAYTKLFKFIDTFYKCRECSEFCVRVAEMFWKP